MPTKKVSSNNNHPNDNATPGNGAVSDDRPAFRIVEDEDRAEATTPGAPTTGDTARNASASSAAPQTAPPPQPPPAQAASATGISNNHPISGGIDPVVKAFLCGGAFVLGTAVFGPIGGKLAAILTGAALGGGHHAPGHNAIDTTFS